MMYAIIDTRTREWRVVYLPRFLLTGLFMTLFHPDAALFKRVGKTLPEGWRWERVAGVGYCYFSSPKVAVGFWTKHHSLI